MNVLVNFMSKSDVEHFIVVRFYSRAAFYIWRDFPPDKIVQPLLPSAWDSVQFLVNRYSARAKYRRIINTLKQVRYDSIS
jgi:hypothetical protein